MKKTIVLLFCTALAATLLAQNAFRPVALVDDVKRQLSAASASLNAMESDFTQTKYVALLSEALVSKGVFLYQKPDRISLDYTSPTKFQVKTEGQKVQMIANGKTTTYDISTNKTLVQMQQLLSACLTGDFKALAPDYDLAFSENSLQYRIEAWAKKGNKVQIGSVDILFDKKDMSVQKIRFTEVSGDYTEYIYFNKKK